MKSKILFILSVITIIAGISALSSCNMPQQIEKKEVSNQVSIGGQERASSLPSFKTVACGDLHSLALDNNGVLWVAGDNHSGQIGLGSKAGTNKWTKSSLTNVTLIACGASHSICVSNGWLYVTGDNFSGELGLGDTKTRNTWTKTGYGNITQIACGVEYSMFVSQGWLWVTGSNECGQLGTGNNDDIHTWTQLGYGNITKIVCGGFHSMFISQGYLWVTGDDSLGQLGAFDTGTTNTWHYTGNNVKDIACGLYHSLCIGNDGDSAGNRGFLYVTGYNNLGQLGVADGIVPYWKKTGYANITQIACGEYNSMFVSQQGELWITGDNTYGQLGLNIINSSLNSWTRTYLGGITSIDCFRQSMFVSQGALWVTGWNKYGQLGNGNTNNLNVFTKLQ